MQKIPFISEFQSFHEFYNESYKENKGTIMILIEFGIFIEIYILLVVSFYKVSTTNPGNIPNDNV